MPKRHDEYRVPNRGILHGKNVRITSGRTMITFNSLYLVIPRNDLQGTPDSRHRPLPHTRLAPATNIPLTTQKMVTTLIILTKGSSVLFTRTMRQEDAMSRRHCT